MGGEGTLEASAGRWADEIVVVGVVVRTTVEGIEERERQ
jgi:hypothetical protein